MGSCLLIVTYPWAFYAVKSWGCVLNPLGFIYAVEGLGLCVLIMSYPWAIYAVK